MIFEFIKKLSLNENSVVLEIGAHMGFDTQKIRECIGDSKFFIFEPDDRNYKILNERKIYEIVDAIIPFAVSDTTGEALFYQSDGRIPEKTGNEYYDNNTWSASSSMREPKDHLDVFPWCSFNNPKKVRTITLDKFCENQKVSKIDFIWMDVQGCEDLIFSGGKNILKNTEYIYTEYSNKELYKGQSQLSNLISNHLPGKWEIVIDFGDNVLLRNQDLHESKITQTGSWYTKDLNEHAFDSDLCNNIIKYLKEEKIKSVIDLGCGTGEYVKKIIEEGIYAEGYDGNINTPELSKGLCKVLDISNPISFKNNFDCVISLEVGEHIPEIYEENFINNILNINSELIIISWAIPNQGGYGHVNCRENEYIINKIIGKGNYKYQKEISDSLRDISKLTWFKKTIMVFKKL